MQLSDPNILELENNELTTVISHGKMKINSTNSFNMGNNKYIIINFNNNNWVSKPDILLNIDTDKNNLYEVFHHNKTNDIEYIARGIIYNPSLFLHKYHFTKITEKIYKIVNLYKSTTIIVKTKQNIKMTVNFYCNQSKIDYVIYTKKNLTDYQYKLLNINKNIESRDKSPINDAIELIEDNNIEIIESTHNNKNINDDIEIINECKNIEIIDECKNIEIIDKCENTGGDIEIIEENKNINECDSYDNTYFWDKENVIYSEENEGYHNSYDYYEYGVEKNNITHKNNYDKVMDELLYESVIRKTTERFNLLKYLYLEKLNNVQCIENKRKYDKVMNEINSINDKSELCKMSLINTEFYNAYCEELFRNRYNKVIKELSSKFIQKKIFKTVNIYKNRIYKLINNGKLQNKTMLKINNLLKKTQDQSIIDNINIKKITNSLNIYRKKHIIDTLKLNCINKKIKNNKKLITNGIINEQNIIIENNNIIINTLKEIQNKKIEICKTKYKVEYNKQLEFNKKKYEINKQYEIKYNEQLKINKQYEIKYNEQLKINKQYEIKYKEQLKINKKKNENIYYLENIIDKYRDNLFKLHNEIKNYNYIINNNNEIK